VVRILARILGDATEFRDSASAAKAMAPVAEGLMPEAFAGDHNQAMMELGATVCTRHHPLCLLCPVRSFCAAAEGDPERYPRLAAKSVERRSVVRLWCVKNGALLLHRAHAKARRLANLHELPTAEHLSMPEAEAALRPLIARRVRGITRFRITESIHACDSPRGALPEGLAWVPLERLEDVALSGPHRRWIGEILATIEKNSSSR
jgi:A/G-specific adenine glycosylase